MIRNLQGLTLINGLWQRINYTDTAEQRYGLYTFATKVVTVFRLHLNNTYTFYEEIVVTIFVEEEFLVINKEKRVLPKSSASPPIVIFQVPK